MAEVIYCENCHSKQPNDWQSGDLCMECGGAVRADVHCTWCTELTPANGKFCKHCGSEVLEATYFGAARILKSLGYNQTELPEQLKKLPAAKLQQYQEQYNQSYRLIQYNKEQLRLLAPYMLINIEEAEMAMESLLLKQIPFETSYLKRLEEEVKKGITATDLIADFELGWNHTTKYLAQLASYKQIPISLAAHPNLANRIANVLPSASMPYYRLEVALWFSHPNSFNEEFNWKKHFETVEQHLKNGQTILGFFKEVLLPKLQVPQFRSYAAQALFHVFTLLDVKDDAVYEQVELIALENKTHADTNLVFTSALLFEDSDTLDIVATKNTPVAQLAFYRLLQQDYKRATIALDIAKLTEYQLNALLDYTELEDDRFAKENNGKLGKYKPLVYSAGNLLLKYWNNHSIFDKPIEKLSSEKLIRHARFLGRFAIPESTNDWDYIVNYLQHNDELEALQKLVSAKPTNFNYTSTLSKYLFNCTALFKDEIEGYEAIAKWLPILEAGYFPDTANANKLVSFLHYTLTFFQYHKFSKKFREHILETLAKLVHSPNDASLPVAHFFFHRALDTRDYINADFMIHRSVNHYILSKKYYVTNNSGGYTPYSFTATNTFIDHFFNGSWEHFINKLHHILPIGAGYGHNAYDLMSRWFSPDLAKQYEQNPDWMLAAHEALKESFLFVKGQGQELLNITTEEGIYPLVNHLGVKQWDAGDVMLFYYRNANIPMLQVENGYGRFFDWLEIDGGSNYYTEVFEKYGQHLLAFTATDQIPLVMLMLWFQKCDRDLNAEDQIEFFQQKFSLLLAEAKHGKLPVMNAGGHPFPITGKFLCESFFQKGQALESWVQYYAKHGMVDPLNQFIVLSFYDTRLTLTTLVTPTQLQAIYNYLLSIAYSASKAENLLQETYLPLIVDTLIALFNIDNNPATFTEIWALKDIHTCIKDTCEQFAAKHFLDNTTTIDTKFIEHSYAYLDDYYYSLGRDAQWVSDLLMFKSTPIASYFNNTNSTETTLDNLVNYLLLRLQKCNTPVFDNNQIQSIGKELTAHLQILIKDIHPKKFKKELVKELHTYVNGSEIDFFYQTKLENPVALLYEYHFSEQEDEAPITTTSNTNVVTDNNMSIDETTQFLMTFKVGKESLEKIITYLGCFKENEADNPMLLSPLSMHMAVLKPWLVDNATIAMQLYQALYLVVLDTDTAPGGAFTNVGAMSRAIFSQLLQGTVYANSYAQGLQAMAASGAYAQPVSDALLQVVNALNS